ncbi:MAG: hypothetical protein WD872_15350 [Pirellulaceae bacterium]
MYGHFDRDFLWNSPQCLGKLVRLRQQPLLGGKNATFWHLISVDNESDSERVGPRLREINRVPDLERCERIRWIRPILEATDGKVLRWKAVTRTSHGNDKRLLLSLTDFSYLVVLSERSSHFLLVTAYWVQRKQRREALARDYGELKP